MAISTLDGLLAGMRYPRYFMKNVSPANAIGKMMSLWPLTGIPGAGVYDNTLNGVVLSSSSAQVAGQLPFDDPVSGLTYLTSVICHNAGAGAFYLVDRLWHNGGFTITSTSAQTLTSPTWPARDINGATSGDGVLIGLEVSSQVGAAAPTLTLSYTNSDGTSGRIGTNLVGTVTNGVVGTFIPIQLQAGDTGVQSVQSLTLSASWISGTINLIAYRILAAVDNPNVSTGNSIDIFGTHLCEMFAGSVPFLLFSPTTTTVTALSGMAQWSQG